MNPILAALLVLLAALAVVLAIGGLARIGRIEEPGGWHTATLAGVSGALIGLVCSVLVVAPIFLSLVLGGFALLALHYRGDGRWAELGLLLVAFGGVLAALWGILLLQAAAGIVRALPGLTVPVFFGVGIATLTLGVATLVLRPGKPPAS